jgi:2-polyprenyl-6-methoxyphenol hydroxylase-like FAD-dependent oxidoreductase
MWFIRMLARRRTRLERAAERRSATPHKSVPQETLMRSHLSSQALRQQQPDEQTRGRAVVLGGSLAGLLAARVLADHLDEVVVVDRDDLDCDLTGPRRGVAQSRHTHGLLVRGTDAIESIVPGFTAGLLARGALRADVLSRSRWLMSDNILCREPSGLVGLLASRTLVESEVRRRVAPLANVVLLGSHDIVGLRPSPDGGRVAGVVLATGRRPVREQPDSDAQPPARELAADLVVDATGRGSRAPRWLADLSYPVPGETVVEAKVQYVTRLFRSRRGVLDDLDADIVGTRPASGRAGVALRQEGDRWTVTLAEQFGGQPPTDLDGFRAFSHTLPTEGIATIAERCEPLGDAVRFSYPASRWRHWETLDRRLEGLVVIGDAVCSFNPIYGQGMSSAAQQVLVLRDLLQARGVHDLGARSAKEFARVVATPWALATGSDRRFPGQPPKPLVERLMDRYLDRLLAVATEDPVVTKAFGRVLNLLEAPPSLLAPRLAWQVLGPQSLRTVRRARAARSHRSVVAIRPAGSTQSLSATAS